MSLNIPEPPPAPGTGDTWKLVIADMEERRRVGIAKYKTPLQPDNGRDSLVDAYQEGLDFVVYIRNAIEQRNQRVQGLLHSLGEVARERDELRGDLFAAQREIQRLTGSES